MLNARSRMVSATPGSMLVSTPARNEVQPSAGVGVGHTRGSQTSLLSEVNGCARRAQVGDAAKQSKDYIWRGHRMRDGARDSKLCALSQPIASPFQDSLTKVSRSGLTVSSVKFPPAITLAQSVVELPTSSRTLTAAWEMV